MRVAKEDGKFRGIGVCWWMKGKIRKLYNTGRWEGEGERSGWKVRMSRWKQVRCEFNLYPLYEENGVKCI